MFSQKKMLSQCTKVYSKYIWYGRRPEWVAVVSSKTLVVSCSMVAQRDRRAPPLPDELFGCDGQRFRWPETLQLFKQFVDVAL